MSDKFEPIGTLFSSVEKLIFEPSWRRLFHLILSASVVLAAVAAFELYTRTFELARLEKSVELLRKLHALKLETGETNNQEIVRMGQALEFQIKDLVRSLPSAPVLAPANQIIEPSGWLKFLAALTAWLIVILLMVRSEAKKGGKVSNTFMGGMTVAVFFAVVAMFIPTWHWPWFNLLIYPILQFVFILVIALVGVVLARELKKKP